MRRRSSVASAANLSADTLVYSIYSGASTSESSYDGFVDCAPAVSKAKAVPSETMAARMAVAALYERRISLIPDSRRSPTAATVYDRGMQLTPEIAERR